MIQKLQNLISLENVQNYIVEFISRLLDYWKYFLCVFVTCDFSCLWGVSGFNCSSLWTELESKYEYSLAACNYVLNYINKHSLTHKLIEERLVRRGVTEDDDEDSLPHWDIESASGWQFRLANGLIICDTVRLSLLGVFERLRARPT